MAKATKKKPAKAKKPTISAQEIAKLVEQVESITSEAERLGVELSSDERKRMPKFRKGGDAIVRLVAKLAKAQGLEIKALPVANMLKDLDEANTAQPLADATSGLAQLAADIVLARHGMCWKSLTAHYTILGRAAESDNKLAKALKPAKEFFATGPRDSGDEPPAGGPPTGKK